MYDINIVSVKITGYVNVPVKIEKDTSTEEIYEKANKIVEEMNFGELENIDWDAQEIIG